MKVILVKTMSDNNGGGGSNQDELNVRVIQLEPRAELRVQVNEAALVGADTGAAAANNANANANSCCFKLISGTAEMFGTELAQVREHRHVPCACHQHTNTHRSLRLGKRIQNQTDQVLQSLLLARLSIGHLGSVLLPLISTLSLLTHFQRFL